MSAIHPEYSGGDRGPWFEFRGHPVHAPALLVALGVVSMLLTTAAMVFGHRWIGGVLAFSSEAIWQKGQVWRLGSYVLWNEPSAGFWFIWDMLMLWWFGRELDGFFGRRIFLKLCAGLVLVPALVGAVVGGVAGAFGWGGGALGLEWVGLSGNFSLMVAYATLAPGVALFAGVPAMWLALLCVILQVLMCVSGHAWGQLLVSVSGAVFSYTYVRYQQGLWDWGTPWRAVLRWIGVSRIFPRRPLSGTPQFRVLEPVLRPLHPADSGNAGAPGSAGNESRKVTAHGGAVPSQGLQPLRIVDDMDGPDVVDAIDPLLEKITRSGMASLTAAERTQLQEAREVLLRRESRDRSGE
ncbi:MAG: hypothetical protein RLZZ142_1345 [Verrucomicrobiota bacterium]